ALLQVVGGDVGGDLVAAAVELVGGDEDFLDVEVAFLVVAVALAADAEKGLALVGDGVVEALAHLLRTLRRLAGCFLGLVAAVAAEVPEEPERRGEHGGDAEGDPAQGLDAADGEAAAAGHQASAALASQRWSSGLPVRRSRSSVARISKSPVRLDARASQPQPRNATRLPSG